MQSLSVLHGACGNSDKLPFESQVQALYGSYDAEKFTSDTVYLEILRALKETVSRTAALGKGTPNE